MEGFLVILRTIRIRCFYTLLRSRGHHLDDSTDRRQPVYHRVSTVKGVSVVHQLDGKETVGCRACLCSSVQHHNVCCLGISVRTHQRIACYLPTYSADMHPHGVEHSPDESLQHSSSYADAEPEYPEGYVYDICSRYVIVVVIICQLPQLSNVVSLGPTCYGNYFYLLGISNTLVVLNSAINFIMYILCNKRFRAVLMVMVFKRPAPQQVVIAHEMAGVERANGEPGHATRL